MSEARRYEDFDLLVSAGDQDAYQVRVLATPGGGASAGAIHAPASELHMLDAAIAAWRGLALDRAGTRDLGAALMEWLFRGPAAQLYRAGLARVAADAEHGCRIRLRIEPPELHGIPWETCYDVETAGFLAQDPRTPLVRYLLGMFGRARLTSAHLKVLTVIASPRGLPTLRTADEYARIEDALDALGGRVAIEPPVKSLDELQDALRRGPNVLHFIGHGGFDPATGGHLILDDGHGGPELADAEVLASYLRGSSVRLAVLNACESAATDPADSFAGVAPRLAQAGLPAVIAMQTFLPDEVAPTFSRAFYRAVADGWPLEAAITAGRQALFGHTADKVYWSIPVLYLSAADGMLWEPETAPAGENKPAPPSSGEAPASSFQFNFHGPVTINAAMVGGNQYVTRQVED